MTFTPWRSSGTILLSGLAFGIPSTPIIIGMFGPVMSASSRPTDAPSRASATARLTLTVLFPTPPLPEATAMMFFTPGTSSADCDGVARRTVAPQLTSMPLGAERRERGPDLALDLVLERAGRGRQLDREGDVRAVHHEVLHHVPRDEVAAELGLPDGAERVEDGGIGQGRHRSGSPCGAGVGAPGGPAVATVVRGFRRRQRRYRTRPGRDGPGRPQDGPRTSVTARSRRRPASNAASSSRFAR